MQIVEHLLGNIDTWPDAGNYHIETVYLDNEDLAKPIQRLESDHGNEFGLRLDRQELPIKSGDIIAHYTNDEDEDTLVVVHTHSQEMIVITPSDIDQMGIIAHLLGNTHKPVKVENAQIILERDPVVEKILAHNDIKFELKNITLTEPLEHVDLRY
ncbi:MAG: urease accessory protein UreE [Aeriscardovia sp.]|nr:urease accessory protein UreE [Aeriscardovia sp.]MBR4413923.1 urease accessory protein UreE [Aeriscardovia sp.]